MSSTAAVFLNNIRLTLNKILIGTYTNITNLSDYLTFGAIAHRFYNKTNDLYPRVEL